MENERDGAVDTKKNDPYNSHARYPLFCCQRLSEEQKERLSIWQRYHVGGTVKDLWNSFDLCFPFLKLHQIKRVPQDYFFDIKSMEFYEKNNETILLFRLLGKKQSRFFNLPIDFRTPIDEIFKDALMHKFTLEEIMKELQWNVKDPYCPWEEPQESEKGLPDRDSIFLEAVYETYVSEYDLCRRLRSMLTFAEPIKIKSKMAKAKRKG